MSLTEEKREKRESVTYKILCGKVICSCWRGAGLNVGKGHFLGSEHFG